MATHDPMDLDVRSQAFYKNFYHFHKNSCDAWYIKDTNHEILDASLTFSSFFPHVSPTGTKMHRHVCSDSYLLYESEVIENKNRIKLFTNGMFVDLNGNKTFIIELAFFKFSDMDCVIAFFRKPSDFFMQTDFLNFAFDISDFERPVLNEDLKGINPREVLTEREWEIIWLVFMGKPNRWIADFLRCSRQNIEYTLSRAYNKLQVFSRSNLIINAMNYGWVNYIPYVFSEKEVLIRI